MSRLRGACRHPASEDVLPECATNMGLPLPMPEPFLTVGSPKDPNLHLKCVSDSADKPVWAFLRTLAGGSDFV